MRHQIRDLHRTSEAQILNDLDDKLYALENILLQRPELTRVIEKNSSPEKTFAIYTLNLFSHAHDMHERELISEMEWNGWEEWMRRCFQEGTLHAYWNDVDVRKIFDQDFKSFIDKDVAAKK
jgi:hypothetical protein